MDIHLIEVNQFSPQQNIQQVVHNWLNPYIMYNYVGTLYL